MKFIAVDFMLRYFMIWTSCKGINVIFLTLLQDSYVEPKPSRHVDHGLTYVEQAYAKPGFHFPIIDASKQVC